MTVKMGRDVIVLQYITKIAAYNKIWDVMRRITV